MKNKTTTREWSEVIVDHESFFVIYVMLHAAAIVVFGCSCGKLEAVLRNIIQSL